MVHSRIELTLCDQRTDGRGSNRRWAGKVLGFAATGEIGTNAVAGARRGAENELALFASGEGRTPSVRCLRCAMGNVLVARADSHRTAASCSTVLVRLAGGQWQEAGGVGDKVKPTIAHSQSARRYGSPAPPRGVWKHGLGDERQSPPRPALRATS